jgi:hypothetical protein
MMESNFYSFVVLENIATSGARLALPMGVTPEAIVEFYLFEYRLNFSLDVFAIFVLQKIFFTSYFSIGCVFSAPNGSIPRGYDGVLAADTRLKILFLRLVRTRNFSFGQIMMSLLTNMTIFSSVFTLYEIFDVSTVHHYDLHA